MRVACPPRLIAACLAAACAQPVLSADPARGRDLYARTNAAPLSCGENGSCHGPDPAQSQYKLLRGAGNSALIERVIAGNRGGMGFLAAYVTPQDIVDIAQYLKEVADGRPVTGVAAPPPDAAAADPGAAATPPGPAGATPTSSAALAPPSVASPFNLGGGGCSVGSALPADPLLPGLVAVAGLLLGLRRRAARGRASGADVGWTAPAPR